MCYAISTGADPFGPYYRYEFLRPLFPDYPRPAVWPDGYYVPTSTGDDVIQKHACVVDRARMLQRRASHRAVLHHRRRELPEQRRPGRQALPPSSTPNIMMATGGTQLKNVLEDDGVYAWQFARRLEAAGNDETRAGRPRFKSRRTVICAAVS